MNSITRELFNEVQSQTGEVKTCPACLGSGWDTTNRIDLAFKLGWAEFPPVYGLCKLCKAIGKVLVR